MIDQASRLRALVDDNKKEPVQPPPPLPLAPEFQGLRPERDLAAIRREKPPPGHYIIASALLKQDAPVDGGADKDDYGYRPQMENTRIIAVTSGKGGVGKTNLTVNLAVAFQEAGKNVVIIDADMGTANVDVILGSTSKRSLLNLLDDGVVFDDILTHGPHGVDYIAGGSGMEHIAELTESQRRVLWEKMAAAEGRADIILIDTGAGIGKNVLNFILAANEVILVTTPEPTSLTDAYAVMKAYSRYEREKTLRLVVNRVYDETDCADVVAKLKTTAERFLGLSFEYIGCIYEDRNVLQSVRRQTPFTVADKGTIASRCVRSLAQKILTGKSPAVKRGWREFLTKFWS